MIARPGLAANGPGERWPGREAVGVLVAADHLMMTVGHP
jgi:hypothetical protein